MISRHSRVRPAALGPALLLLGAVALRLLPSSPVEAAPPARPPGPARAQAKDARLKMLLKERLGVLREVAALTEASYRQGQTPLDQVLESRRAVLEAELVASVSDRERVPVLQQLVNLQKELEESVNARYRAGAATGVDVSLARAARLEAEIALERVKARMPARRR